MLTSKQVLNTSHVLTDENGEVIATLTGQVTPAKAVSMSLVVQAEADSRELTVCVDDFWHELCALAAANDVPIDVEAVDHGNGD